MAKLLAGMEIRMKRNVTRILPILLCCLLLTFLAACGSSTTSNPVSTQTTVAQTHQGNASPAPTLPAGNPGSSNGTQPMPATSTACPAPGSARAAVMANLAVGNHNTLVYVVNEFQSSGGTAKAGTLKRYDVDTNTKTVILGIPNVSIHNAQVSGDGKWVLFTTYTNPQYQLQLVRMDGQGLQTLTCFANNSIDNPQLSADMKHVIFSVHQSSQDVVYLLTLATGALQRVLTVPIGDSSQGVHIGVWLDNTHVYLSDIPLDQPHDLLYILNINSSVSQTQDTLPALVHKTFGDFDSSYDGSQLFVDYGYCGLAGCNVPGDITVQATTGGAETTILHETNYVVTTLRVVSTDTLLLLIDNNQAGGGSDISHNGLWKIHTNGSGLARLTTDPASQNSSLNTESQFPWSNASRDGKLYALQTSTAHTFTLEYGSLNGGSPNIFASISDGTVLSIAGWITM